MYTFLFVINRTSVLSWTVSEIWRLKGRKSPILPTPTSFNTPSGGTPQSFGMKLALEILERLGYRTVKNFMVLSSTVFV